MPQGLSSWSGSPVIISRPAGSDWIRTWERKQIDVHDSVYEFTKKKTSPQQNSVLRLEPVSMLSKGQTIQKPMLLQINILEKIVNGTALVANRSLSMCLLCIATVICNIHTKFKDLAFQK